jgi:predicted lipoprotein with Yx(FWY)xxD motif
MPRFPALFATAAVAALLASGCSASSSSQASAGSASATTAAPAAPAGRSALAGIGPATATGLTISLARGPQGIFLVGPRGMSLYVFDQDQGTTSGCTGRCAATWPALTDAGPLTCGSGIRKAELGTADGQSPDQVTYYGHLLYAFSGDTAPGQTNGTAVPGWHLLGPFGNVMLPRPPAGGTPTTT